MAMTIEIPEILRLKVDAYVERRRAEYSRYSVKDALLEGLRRLLDEPVTGNWTPAKYTEERERGTPETINGPRKTAAELAASIPGLNLGAGPSGYALQQKEREGLIAWSDPKPLDVGDCPAENVQSMWREPLGKVRAIWQSDSSAGAEEFGTLLGGQMPPSKFAQWATQPKVFEGLVAYLDANREAGPGGW
jgi:hypothetical protein